MYYYIIVAVGVIGEIFSFLLSGVALANGNYDLMAGAMIAVLVFQLIWAIPMLIKHWKEHRKLYNYYKEKYEKETGNKL